MPKLTLQELESTLWKAADILRGELNAAQYKDYIFGLLFLKRMNDEYAIERAALMAEYTKQELPKAEIDELLEDLVPRDEIRLAVDLDQHTHPSIMVAVSLDKPFTGFAPSLLFRRRHTLFAQVFDRLFHIIIGLVERLATVDKTCPGQITQFLNRFCRNVRHVYCSFFI